MYRLQRIFELGAILLLLLLISQCAPMGVQKGANLYRVYMHYEDLDPSGFHKEVARLQAITERLQDTSGKAMAHLQLALLYSHYKNPTPNYYRAFKELETYRYLDPEGGKADVIQNWLTMLKEIAGLVKEKKEMKEKIEQLQYKIEQLQYLDIELEKSRKLVK